MRTKTKKKIVRISRDVVSATEDIREIAWATFAPYVAVVTVCALLAIIWFVPIWEISARTASTRLSLSPKDRFDLENSARTTLVQFVGGVVVLAGSWIALRNVKAVERNIKIAQDGQITERYTRAIEQLGSEKPAVRLGGIYALERIARDSARDHGPIMEVLRSYVRSHAPPEGAGVATEVQAIMTVVGRRTWKHELGGSGIDFSGVDLRGVDLCKAYLGDISFDGAILDGANLVSADLEEASFVRASLQFAKMQGLDLCGADLKGASLAKANLSGSNLTGAVNLTAPQVSSAYIDEKTVMTDEMRHELAAIWKQENEGIPEQLKDYAKATALGIRTVPAITPSDH